MSKFIAGWLKLDPGLMNGGSGVYKWKHGGSTVLVRMNIVFSLLVWHISMHIDFLSCDEGLECFCVCSGGVCTCLC